MSKVNGKDKEKITEKPSVIPPIKTNDKKKKYSKITDIPAFKQADRPKPGLLISRLPQPVEIPYNGASLMLPSRGRKTIPNRDKLGAIPHGVFLK